MNELDYNRILYLNSLSDAFLYRSLIKEKTDVFVSFSISL